MKKLLSLLISIAMLSSAMPVLAAENDDVKEFHVAVDGTKTGSGTASDPLDSIATAKEKVAEYKADYPNTPIEVIFHEGDYRFTDTVKFTAADAGSEKAPVTYKAAEGEEVKFKGSKVIDASKIKVVTDAKILAKLPADARGKVGYIDLAEQGITDAAEIAVGFNMWNSRFEGSELYLNNERQTIARWPNGENGYDQYESVISAGSTGGGTSGVGGVFQTKDFRLMNWETAEDAWAVGFWGCDYYYERVPIESIDVASKQIKLKYSSVYGLSTAYSRRFAVINLLEELDVPGEWYIDHDTDILYYYPERTLLGAKMEITTLGTNLIELNGTSNLKFEGLTFSQTRGCAIQMIQKNVNIDITHCTFDNIGRFAIYQFSEGYSQVGQGTAQASQFSENGAVNLHVDNNTFRDIGVRAIELYCGARDANELSGCTFNNNYLYAIGSINPSSYGMQIYGVGVEIAYNTIHQAGYGIGWVGADFDIHHNEIYNVMNQLNDGSAIYTGRNFINRGNKVHHNYIHDASEKSEYTDGNLCSGIYLDDYDCGTEVYQNIVKDTHAAIMVNNGMSNDVHDNIAVDSPSTAIRLSEFLVNKQGAVDRAKIQGEAALKLPGYARYPDIKTDFDSGLAGEPALNTIVDNLSVRGKFTFGDRMYQLNTIEKNHEVGDEEFVDPENGDYRLKNTSKYAATTDALTEDFDMSSIGLQTKEYGENIMLTEGFKLTYPANGTRGIQTEKVTFSWQRPIGADRFTVRIASDSRMQNIVKEVETYESTVTIDGFEKGSTYYWKVYANNESLIEAKDIESLGVPHMFTIANKFKTDTTDLMALIIAGRNITVTCAILQNSEISLKIGTIPPPQIKFHGIFALRRINTALKWKSAFLPERSHCPPSGLRNTNSQ